MTKAQHRLTAALLDLAGEHFGNHSCNDFDLRSVLTADESSHVIAQLNAYNAKHNPDDHRDVGETIVEDWVLMHWLAHVLESGE